LSPKSWPGRLKSPHHVWHQSPLLRQPTDTTCNNVNVFIYVFIYIINYMCMCIYVYIYIYHTHVVVDIMGNVSRPNDWKVCTLLSFTWFWSIAWVHVEPRGPMPPNCSFFAVKTIQQSNIGGSIIFEYKMSTRFSI
jgi:hypothetical protein